MNDQRTRHLGSLLTAGALLVWSAMAIAQDAPRYHVAPLGQGGPSGDATEVCTESFGQALQSAGGYAPSESASSAEDTDILVVLTAHDALGSWYVSGRVLDADGGATLWHSEELIDNDDGAMALRDSCGWMAYHYLEASGHRPPAFSSPVLWPIFVPENEAQEGIPMTELVTYVSRARNRDLPADEWDAAVDLFQRGCAANHNLGCAGLARMYRLGFGVDRDYSLAVALYQDACDNGDPESCSDLGRMYREGQGVRENREQANNYFRIACEAGFEEACDNLGQRYQRSEGHMGDFGQTSALYQRACEDGVMSGCTGLGYVLETGDGLERDTERARMYYEQACEGGDLDGCARLGGLYENGEAVGRDQARALELYTQACAGGSALGCDFAGSIYRDGIGVPADAARARDLYEEACQGGNPHACGQLR